MTTNTTILPNMETGKLPDDTPINILLIQETFQNMTDAQIQAVIDFKVNIAYNEGMNDQNNKLLEKSLTENSYAIDAMVISAKKQLEETLKNKPVFIATAPNPILGKENNE